MTACALCPVYSRPARDRRDAETGLACAGCLEIMDRDLADLATLAAAHPAMLPPRGAGGGHPGSNRAAGPRLPLSLDALSLLGPGSALAPSGGGIPPLVLLREWATRWAILRSMGLPAEEREYEPGPDGTPTVKGAAGITALAFWLRARLTWAAEELDAFPRFAREVGACLSAVRRVAGDALPMDTAAGRRIGWCPAEVDEGGPCMTPLSASTWDDVIKCAGCGAEYHRDAGGWTLLARAMQATSTGLSRKDRSR